MDNHRPGRVIAAALLAVLIGIGIAVVAYNAGVSQGALTSGKVIAPPPGAQYVYVRPWGFGFGFFPLLLLFFGFFMLRVLFWGRYWRGGYGHYHCMHGHQPEPPPAGPTQA